MRITAGCLILVACALAGSSFAAEEELTITTHYPAPYGVNKILRLHPAPRPGIGCDTASEGTMYYDNGDSKSTTGIEEGLYVCNGTAWQPVKQGSASAAFGGMFQNGEFSQNGKCDATGIRSSCSNDLNLYACCESTNPFTGNCTCPAGFQFHCLAATKEINGTWSAVTDLSGTPHLNGDRRDRYDEHCFCYKN